MASAAAADSSGTHQLQLSPFPTAQLCPTPTTHLITNSATPHMSSSAIAFSVLSYNIWGIFNSKDTTVRIETMAAEKFHHFDILCLQENFNKDDFELILKGVNGAWAKKNLLERQERMKALVAAKQQSAVGGGNTMIMSPNSGIPTVASNTDNNGLLVETPLSPTSTLGSPASSSAGGGGASSNLLVRAKKVAKGGGVIPPAAALPPRYHGIHSVSSFVGPGLAIITRFPIMSHNFYRFPLQGAPELVYHGDYFCSKGVTVSRLQISQNTFENGFGGSGSNADKNSPKKAGGRLSMLSSGATGSQLFLSTTDSHVTSPDVGIHHQQKAKKGTPAFNNPSNTNLAANTSVVVYNTHLVAQYEKYSQKPCYSAETYAAVRLTQAAFLADIIATTSAEDDNVIICGDFNCAPESPEFALLSAILSRRHVLTKERLAKEDEALKAAAEDSELEEGTDDEGAEQNEVKRKAEAQSAAHIASNQSNDGSNKQSNDDDDVPKHPQTFKPIALTTASCLVKALPTDTKTNVTYSLENAYNSSSTSYFQLLSMVEDLPVQLDHILYRHHFLAEEKATSEESTEQPSTDAPSLTDTNTSSTNTNHRIVGLGDNFNMSHRKLVLRMVPLFFAQSNVTIDALKAEMSPLFLTAATSLPQGCVMHFNNAKNPHEKPLSDHWGVACRFVLAPMDPHFSYRFGAVGGDQQACEEGMDSSQHLSPEEVAAADGDAPLPFGTTATPSSTKNNGSGVVVPVCTSTTTTTRRLLLETASFPLPNQFMTACDYKHAAAARKVLGISTTEGRLAYEKTLFASLLKRATAEADIALAKQARIPDAKKQQHGSSSTSNPIAALLSTVDSRTYQHTQNGADIFYHNENPITIIRFVNQLLKRKVDTLEEGRKQCMRWAIGTLCVPIAAVTFLMALPTFNALFGGGGLSSADSSSAEVIAGSATGVSSASSTSAATSLATLSSAVAGTTIQASTAAVITAVSAACSIAAIINVLIGKLQREVDGLVLGNITQSLDLLEGERAVTMK